jgi:hypothetical protein
VEYASDPTDPALDYAVLRLVDRVDAPLEQYGYLKLDRFAPLTIQTALSLIQHPLGQPQQFAEDIYAGPSAIPGRILYHTPAEAGTSGAPVINRANWRVVAMHNGENRHTELREGTLLATILSDMRGHHEVLYTEIDCAQQAGR